MQDAPSQDPITESEIRTLVTRFYVKVRKDPLLAPIFAAKVKGNDWPSHEDRIADFWSSVFLKTGRFDGNPMQKHLSLPGLTPQHFQRWLELFEQTARDTLNPSQASHVDLIARRIGQSLQMGLAFHCEKSGLADHPFEEFSMRRTL